MTSTRPIAFRWCRERLKNLLHPKGFAPPTSMVDLRPPHAGYFCLKADKTRGFESEGMTDLIRGFSTLWLFFCIGAAGLSACYDDLTTEDLCRPAFSGCDYDGDGVYNQADEFPADAACQVASAACVCTQSNEFCDYDGDGILNGMTRYEDDTQSSSTRTGGNGAADDASTADVECRQYGYTCGYGGGGDGYTPCCSGSICIDQSEYSQCMYSCDGGCPEGFTCQWMDNDYACVGFDAAATPAEVSCKPLGYYCSASEPCCEGGICILEDSGDYSCLRSCDGGCPEGMICNWVGSGYACVNDEDDGNDGCGNDVCDSEEYEYGSCATDCGYCGDGVCQNLDWEYCYQDCQESPAPSDEEGCWDEGGEGDGESGSTSSSGICGVSEDCLDDACGYEYELCWATEGCLQELSCAIDCVDGVPINSCTYSSEAIILFFDCLYDYCVSI
jgi:hypothetical protein